MGEASKKTNGNIIDNLIGYFSPSRGIYRLKARRLYEAANTGRRSKSFKGASSTGVNAEIAQSLVTLRNRSRHFVRNNGWAKRAVGVITDNTIGEGIRPAPNGTRNQVKKAKSIWNEWAETTACDWYGKSTFYGLQQIIMSEIAEAGDCLIIRRKVIPTDENPLPIKLQVLEGDQLDHTKNGTYTADEIQGYAHLGVQFNSDGLVAGYWIFKEHPTDNSPSLTSLKSEFISKEDVIHPFEILRIGQVRGIPMGVSTFMKMSDFSDYEDAQLMRQKVAAAFAAFVKGRAESSSTDELERIEPGIIEYLNDQEEITFSNPPKADGYDEYSRKILQGIAAGYEITYEMLTMDYSNVNFTSGRMAKIDINGRFKKLQYNMIVPQVCVPVWNWFMEAIQISGKMQTWINCNAMNWTAPRIQQLDPVKETNALILQIKAGITTLSEVHRENGNDPDEMFEEIKREREKLKELGINLSELDFAPEAQNEKTDETKN